LEIDGLKDLAAGEKIYWKLQQFHFHTHSEHEINGATYPMEMHIVHTLEPDQEDVPSDYPQEFTVLGIFFDIQPNVKSTFLDDLKLGGGVHIPLIFIYFTRKFRD
jgi:hypothetical protein